MLMLKNTCKAQYGAFNSKHGWKETEVSFLPRICYRLNKLQQNRKKAQTNLYVVSSKAWIGIKRHCHYLQFYINSLGFMKPCGVQAVGTVSCFHLPRQERVWAGPLRYVSAAESWAARLLSTVLIKGWLAERELPRSPQWRTLAAACVRACVRAWAEEIPNFFFLFCTGPVTTTLCWCKGCLTYLSTSSRRSSSSSSSTSSSSSRSNLTSVLLTQQWHTKEWLPSRPVAKKVRPRAHACFAYPFQIKIICQNKPKHNFQI